MTTPENQPTNSGGDQGTLSARLEGKERLILIWIFLGYATFAMLRGRGSMPVDLSPEMFEAIEIGMTQEQITEIIGTEGSFVENYMTYEWYEDGVQSMSISFRDGDYSGAGGGSIAEEKWEAVMAGLIGGNMTYEEIVEINGAEGSLVFESRTHEWIGRDESSTSVDFSGGGTVLWKSSRGLESAQSGPTGSP